MGSPADYTIIALVVAIGVNANEIHKWAHRSRRQNGRLISFFQDVGLLQSAGHHARHHRGSKATHYCVVTNYLNPVLERIRFWAALERILVRAKEHDAGKQLLRRRKQPLGRGHRRT